MLTASIAHRDMLFWASGRSPGLRVTENHLFSHLPMYFYTVALILNINSPTVAGAAPALFMIRTEPKCTGFPFNPDYESAQGTCSVDNFSSSYFLVKDKFICEQQSL